MPKVLVTGAASRLGRAIGLHLASKGYALAVHYHRSRTDAEKTAHDARAFGVEVTLHHADLSTPDGARQLLATTGQPDVMVLNASLFQRDSALDADYASWHAHHMVHGYSSLALMQAMQGKQNGQIISLLDHSSHLPQTDFCSYSLSKAQLRQLTLIMAKALAPAVRVNGLALGYVMPATSQRQSHFDGLVAQTPYGQPIAIEEILQGIDFIMTTPCLYGHILTLDGGASL